MQPNQTISSRQTIVLLISMMLGVGMLTVPRSVAKIVGTQDAWMAVLTAGVVAIIQVAAVGKLCTVFPRQDFLTYTGIILGKPLSRALGLLFALNYTILFAYETRVMGAVVRQYLLDQTPLEVIVLLMFFASAYLITGGIGPIVRVNQLFLPIILFFFVMGLGFSMQNFELNNLLPLFQSDIKLIIRGAVEANFSLIGFEVLLFISVFIPQTVQLVRSGVWAVSIVALMTTLVLWTAVGIFGAATLSNLTWAGLEIVRNIEIPKGLIERTESIFLTVWIMMIFTTASLSHYVASLLLGQIWNRKQRVFIFGLLPIAYIFAMVPKSLLEVFELGTYMSAFGLVLGGITPALLLLLAKIRRLGTYAKK